MFERFTDRARKVMALANQEAQRIHHEYIGTEHILLGLVKEGSGVGAGVLRNLGVDLKKVCLEVDKLVKSGPQKDTMGKLPQTPRAKRVIEFAIEESRNLNHNYVGTEHLLLGLLREEDGVAAQVLMNLGLKLCAARDEVMHVLGAAAGDGPKGVPGAQSPAEAPPVDTMLRDDVAGLLATALLREFERRKDEAVMKAEYEISAGYRDLGGLVREVRERLVSILGRKSPTSA